MASRLELQTFLKSICPNVYYQPPSNLHLTYPAIIFKRENIANLFANDNVYKQSFFYKLTVVDSDPDSEIAMKVSKLPTCRFETQYASDGLNHFVYIIHF